MVANRPVQQYAYAIGVLALGLAAVFGGLGRAEPERATLVKGQAITADPFTITVDHTSWTTDLGTTGKAKRGHFLTIIGTLRNDTDTTVDFAAIESAVRFEGLTDVYQSPLKDDTGRSEDVVHPYGVFVTDDSTTLSSAAPGLTYTVAWVYEQRGTTAAPTSAEVTVQKHTFEPNVIDQVEHWSEPQNIAAASFPMKKAGS